MPLEQTYPRPPKEPRQLIISAHHLSDNQILKIAGGATAPLKNVHELRQGIARATEGLCGVCNEGALGLLDQVNVKIKRIDAFYKKLATPPEKKKE